MTGDIFPKKGMEIGQINHFLGGIPTRTKEFAAVFNPD